MPLSYEAPRNYTAASGGIPVAVDPQKAAKKAIKATQANLEATKDLGRSTNNFMVNQYTGRVPGYKAMSEQSSANIASALKGEVPQDVINQMAQQAAERGISRGISGAGASNADYLRGLGLTSLGLQKYGEEALTGATHRLDAVKQFDPTTFSVTPEAQYDAMTQANIWAAAPDPEAVYKRGKADLNQGTGSSGGGVNTTSMPALGTGKGLSNTGSPSMSPVVGYGTRPSTSGGWNPTSLWDAGGNWVGGSNSANVLPEDDFGAVGTFESSLPYSPASYSGMGGLGYSGTNTGNIWSPSTGFLDLYGTGATGSGIPGGSPYTYGPNPYDYSADWNYGTGDDFYFDDAYNFGDYLW